MDYWGHDAYVAYIDKVQGHQGIKQGDVHVDFIQYNTIQ